MRESTTTMAYKEKGEAVNVANYRPIAVTATEYRILPSHSDTRYLSSTFSSNHTVHRLVLVQVGLAN